jgi:tRNA(Ile)-lysidine synthetase-like protein
MRILHPVVSPKDARLAWVPDIQQQFAAIQSEGPLLVAVSGGVDSSVLLHLLLSSGRRDLVVCHLDHGWRGAASEADAAFVAELANRVGLPLFTRKLTDAPPVNISLEAAGRAARFELFADAAKRFKTRCVVLGHHADDQVETFLFNLCRGVASPGNAGMKSESPVRVGDLELTLRRPLLCLWKKDLLDYADYYQVEFREDPTNQKTVHSRNRIRQHVVPWLEKQLGRNIKSALLRACEVAQDEGECLDTLLPSAWEQAELKLTAVRELPRALQRRLIYRWLQAQAVENVGFKDVESVRNLVLNDYPAKVNLAGNRHCRRRAGVLFVQTPCE